jgi:hypothetical protein
MLTLRVAAANNVERILDLRIVGLLKPYTTSGFGDAVFGGA